MIYHEHEIERNNKVCEMSSEFVVIGGGMAGVCAALMAARNGVKVVLIQDRPVLGGNASSEVRLWIMGATSHMGNNNRWSREGGIIDEILVENLYRNKEGNPLILDTILLEKVREQENITLLLNTAAYSLTKKDNKIHSIKAFCSQNSTTYKVNGKLFCDSSGDGVVAFLSGAAFRMGSESSREFGELFAPDEANSDLLGQSMYFYSKRVPEKVKYIPPSFILKDIKKIPRYKILNSNDYGCRLWWLEYGGNKDTVNETEDIKWELWKIIYGAWDYIKNSGEFEDVDNLTLEWVGTIPGKRESRRFEGLYTIKQQDVVNQTKFEDGVSNGGWALDLHPSEGVYSHSPSCTQWHSKGVYQIPYRCYVSKDISNLFYAGRIISATHVAFGSSRVMATCAHGGQAVGMAASLCLKHNILPEDVLKKNLISELQNSLNENGQSIWGVPLETSEFLSSQAKIEASSTLEIDEIPFTGDWMQLIVSTGQLLPFKKGPIPEISIRVKSESTEKLGVELRISSKAENYTPDLIMEEQELDISKGEQILKIKFTKQIPQSQYGVIAFKKNENIFLKGSKNRYTGIVSVFNGKNKAVSNNGKQTPPDDIGIESFEFWCPKRRPSGENIGMEFSPALKLYNPENIISHYTRPFIGTNAWVADLEDASPEISLIWSNKRKITSVKIFFDTDYDHPLESSLWGHPEDIIPFCIRKYKIIDDENKILFVCTQNHQSINEIKFKKPILTSVLRIRCEHPSKDIPASIFEVIVK